MTSSGAENDDSHKKFRMSCTAGWNRSAVA